MRAIALVARLLVPISMLLNEASLGFRFMTGRWVIVAAWYLPRVCLVFAVTSIITSLRHFSFALHLIPPVLIWLIVAQQPSNDRLFTVCTVGFYTTLPNCAYMTLLKWFFRCRREMQGECSVGYTLCCSGSCPGCPYCWKMQPGKFFPLIGSAFSGESKGCGSTSCFLERPQCLQRKLGRRGRMAFFGCAALWGRWCPFELSGKLSSDSR